MSEKEKLKTISIKLQLDLGFGILVEKQLSFASLSSPYILSRERKKATPKSTQPLWLRTLKACGIIGCLTCLQKINFSDFFSL